MAVQYRQCRSRPWSVRLWEGTDRGRCCGFRVHKRQTGASLFTSGAETRNLDCGRGVAALVDVRDKEQTECKTPYGHYTILSNNITLQS